MKKKPVPNIIAVRKACKAEGLGLAHFVLMDKPSPPKSKGPKK